MTRSTVHFVALACILSFPIVAESQSEDLAKRAEGGDADAQYELGRMYAEGYGCTLSAR